MSTLYLPALRGYFGDWIYYSCVMKVADVADRVSYPKELHTNVALSDMIQRILETERGVDIADYLRTHKDRFFNSMVVAVYEGSPEWLEFDDIIDSASENLHGLAEDVKHTVGFLRLTEDVKLFALDGQHRLAGIRVAIDAERRSGVIESRFVEDELSIIFVGHNNTQLGIKRTRRLFITLNKTAKIVSKADIIALDEADAIAIITRRMVEKEGIFSGNRTAIQKKTNLSSRDRKHITSIINLYDIISIILSKIETKASLYELRATRPEESELDNYENNVSQYFRAIAEYVPEFREYLTANDSRAPEVIEKYRSKDGGNLLFRPIGQRIFAEVVGAIRKNFDDTASAVRRVASLPLELRKIPYVRVLWNDVSGTVNTRGAVHTRDLMLYMLGSKAKSEAVLKNAQAELLGVSDVSSIKLPRRIS